MLATPHPILQRSLSTLLARTLLLSQTLYPRLGKMERVRPSNSATTLGSTATGPRMKIKIFHAFKTDTTPTPTAPIPILTHHKNSTSLSSKI